MRDEYDLTPEELRKGIRGKFAAGYEEGVHLVPISPNDEIVPDAEATSQDAAHQHGRVDSSRVPRSE